MSSVKYCRKIKTFSEKYPRGIFKVALLIAFATKGVAAVAKPASALMTPITSVEPLLFLLVLFVPNVYPSQSSNIWAIKKCASNRRRTEKMHLPLLPHNLAPFKGMSKERIHFLPK